MAARQMSRSNPAKRSAVTQRHWIVFLIAVLVGFVASAQAQESEAPAAVVRYVELKPTFVANFGVSQTGALKYVKADITVRVSNKDAEYATRYHLPALRNELVFLLSRQDESTMASAEGRETLKAEALQELREVLEAEEGQPIIDDLMFTNFVVQR